MDGTVMHAYAIYDLQYTVTISGLLSRHLAGTILPPPCAAQELQYLRLGAGAA